MLRKYMIPLLCLFALAAIAHADGLLLSSKAEYPNSLLRNRVTKVTVNIQGLVAETVVYQEFVNDWRDTTDAVYSFPLPADARATQFLYWQDETVYKAVLRVRQQAENPGTGEGGMAALVNNYIGRNGLKIELKRITPGAIQRVQLHYVSLCDYFQGEVTYRFPLATGDFVKYPLEHLQFDFQIGSNVDISGYDLPSHPGARVLQSEPRQLHVQLATPKAYIDRDLTFRYRTAVTELGVDFYSVANDSMDGHYALFVRPESQADSSLVIAKRVLFVLSNSSTMVGYKLSQSIEAISQALDLLHPGDEFNILTFNSVVQSWQNAPVVASYNHILQAKSFLESLGAGYGTRMDLALQAAIAQIHDAGLINAILVFTDGYSPIDPRYIAARNTFEAGIFAVGIGEVARERLEMTANLNHGFVTYLDAESNLAEGMLRVFKKISQPVLKDVAMEIGRAGAYDILPRTISAVYAGAYFFTTGRYKNAGASALAIAGQSALGETAFNFQLPFSDKTDGPKFVAHLWAREVIDALEQEIEVYGESTALQDSLITISLRYGIRCRYTAYIADYKDVFTSVAPDNLVAGVPSRSFLLGNYPNPFNPTTTIRFYLSATYSGSTKLIKIYNLLGQLVQVIDISHLPPGFHSLVFEARDFWGNPLPSGIYFVRLQVGDEVSTLRVLLAK